MKSEFLEYKNRSVEFLEYVLKSEGTSLIRLKRQLLTHIKLGLKYIRVLRGLILRLLLFTDLDKYYKSNKIECG